jgi:KipI family sensor histidine kinase inhibitor
MSIRLLPYGDNAILVELADAPERRAFDRALQAADLPDVVEQVPGARTVLVQVAHATQVQALATALRALRLQPSDATDRAEPDPVVVETAYDGEDLASVAEHLGVERDEVVARHTGQLWTVEFIGFAPGFGYLVGDSGGLDVPRRQSPRTRVPAGAVGLAGPYTGVYPRPSPGGWQLIGTTQLQLWDPHRDPPARLTPATRVRFVDVGAGR